MSAKRYDLSCDDKAMFDLLKELGVARRSYANYRSHHEACAVIAMAAYAYWASVRLDSSKRSASAMRSELIQIACTAIRAVYDLELNEGMLHRGCSHD